ncbi:MAG: tetratricopeptide repeat protein [Verrucomicrobiota bacterium]|jgi:predicted Zn-dependent protease
MQPLEPPDSHHLDAAVGWLGLGRADDARTELDLISAAQQQHPAVLDMRWTICAHEKRWSDALEVARAELAAAPGSCSGWLHRAYALRRVPDGGLPQAWDALLPAAEKFPREPVVAYNLSCYACQMQQLDLARHWLKRAIKCGGKDAIRKMALADDDLKPLWAEIREL